MEQTDATRPQARAQVLLSTQALRCFAVMGVILFHVQHYYTNKLRMPDFLPKFDIGSAGVDLFFVAGQQVLALPRTTRLLEG